MLRAVASPVSLRASITARMGVGVAADLVGTAVSMEVVMLAVGCVVEVYVGAGVGLFVGTGDAVGAVVGVVVEVTMLRTVSVAPTVLIIVAVAGGRGVLDGLMVGGGKVGSLVGSGANDSSVNVGSGCVDIGGGGRFVAEGSVCAGGGCAPTLPQTWPNVKRGGGLPALHARPSTSPSLSL